MGAKLTMGVMNFNLRRSQTGREEFFEQDINIHTPLSSMTQ